MRKTALLTFAISLSASGFVTAADIDNLALFTPDMTEAHLAGTLDSDLNLLDALPSVEPFWRDLVNSGDVAPDGTGVYVAVLDTGLLDQWQGFFSQANIADEYGKGFSYDIYCEGESLVIDELDDTRGFNTVFASGHGTHVASTVAGFNYNDTYWIEGVAPGATIIPVLVLDAWIVVGECVEGGIAGFSGGTDEMIAAGIKYVADLKANELEGAPTVINMSLGGPSRSAEIEAAVDYAIEKGVIVVASGGNEGSDGMGYPGGLEQIISAGAAGWASMFNYGWGGDAPERLNKKDELGNTRPVYLENFSSRPNKYLDQKHQDLDVTAPGAWVVGPYKSAFANNTGYYYLSGTSMAAPHVSAMAALLLDEYPTIEQFEMEDILSLGAAGSPLPASDAYVAFPFEEPYYYICTWDGGDYGAGFLQADNALKAARGY